MHFLHKDSHQDFYIMCMRCILCRLGIMVEKYLAKTGHLRVQCTSTRPHCWQLFGKGTWRG